MSLICLLYGTFYPDVHVSNQFLLYLIMFCVNPFIFSVGYAIWLRDRFAKSTALAIVELYRDVSTALLLLRNLTATKTDAEDLLR